MKKNKIVKLANKLKKILKHEKGFRLSGKHLFLTYSQINIDRMKALEQLKEKLEPRKVIKYILSTENHKDSGKHLHVYCELDYRCNIASKSRLDILDEDNKPVHGNYQSCRSYKAVIGYVLKEGKDQALTNMDLDDNGREFNP